MSEPLSEEIYFCRLTRRMPRLSRASLPRETLEHVRALRRLEPRHNVRIVFFIVLWGTAGWAALTAPSLLVELVGVFLMGCSINGLPILMHESSHSLLSRNAAVNRWLGFLCGLPALISVSAYRTLHRAHHAHTRTADDPDDAELSAGAFLPPAVVYHLVLVLSVYVFIAHVGITASRGADRRTKRAIMTEYGLIALACGAAVLVCSAHTLLIVWVYPMLVATALSNVRSLAEHGLTTGGNAFTDTRTVLSNRWVSFWMCNLNYHLEHHLFPGVPWYNLPTLHRLLAGEYRRVGASVYPSYTAFLVDFFRTTWARGFVPNARLIPRAARDEIRTYRSTS